MLKKTARAATAHTFAVAQEAEQHKFSLQVTGKLTNVGMTLLPLVKSLLNYVVPRNRVGCVQ